MGKFNDWRKAQMHAAEYSGIMHFHKVGDCVYWDIRDFLMSLLKKKIDLGHNSTKIILTDTLIEDIFVFLVEMEFSYMHPRSDSAKIAFSRLNRTANPNT